MLLVTFTSLVVKPIPENTSSEPFSAGMINSPFVPVVVPDFLPLTTTVMPSAGLPVPELVTLPDTLFVCAIAC